MTVIKESTIKQQSYEATTRIFHDSTHKNPVRDLYSCPAGRTPTAPHQTGVYECSFENRVVVVATPRWLPMQCGGAAQATIPIHFFRPSTDAPRVAEKRCLSGPQVEVVKSTEGPGASLAFRCNCCCCYRSNTHDAVRPSRSIQRNATQHVRCQV